MAPKPTKLFQVSAPVVVYEEGRRIPLHPGETVYAADHPLVRRFPGAFKEVVPVTGPRVEAAVADPGTARNVTIPDPD